MDQAAFTMGAEPVTEGSARLRLRQGAAAHATWILDDAPGGTLISVGAGAQCDWQIQAASIPACAFWLLFVGGLLFVRADGATGVRLNGRPLESGWVPVPSGARIAVGLARIEASIANTRRNAGDEAGYPSSEPYRTAREDEPGRYPLPDAYAAGAAPAFAVPAVLDEAPRARSVAWGYALVGLSVAGAYYGWIALLDAF